MKFRVQADAYYYAEDIDDALKLLAKQLLQMSQGNNNDEPLFTSGNFMVSKVEGVDL